VNKLLQVNCPQCDKVFYYYQSEYRPFCCEKCKMIDLGHWFHETYRVPSKEQIQGDGKNGDQENEEQNYNEENENDDQNQTQVDDDYEDDENNY
jgi:endogenous inhibitor of DNA gyrase (YacG/DUF329 family)